jgi:hypothetical protein
MENIIPATTIENSHILIHKYEELNNDGSALNLLLRVFNHNIQTKKRLHQNPSRIFLKKVLEDKLNIIIK